MSKPSPTSPAALLQSIADYQPISDGELVERLFADVARLKRMYLTVAVAPALIVTCALLADLDALLFLGARNLSLVLGVPMLGVLWFSFWLTSPPAHQIRQGTGWDVGSWHLSPHQKRDLLTLAKGHPELRPHVARWVESGRPLRYGQIALARAWVSAFDREAAERALAQENQALQHEVQLAGSGAQ